MPTRSVARASAASRGDVGARRAPRLELIQSEGEPVQAKAGHATTKARRALTAACACMRQSYQSPRTFPTVRMAAGEPVDWVPPLVGGLGVCEAATCGTSDGSDLVAGVTPVVSEVFCVEDAIELAFATSAGLRVSPSLVELLVLGHGRKRVEPDRGEAVAGRPLFREFQERVADALALAVRMNGDVLQKQVIGVSNEDEEADDRAVVATFDNPHVVRFDRRAVVGVQRGRAHPLGQARQVDRIRGNGEIRQVRRIFRRCDTHAGGCFHPENRREPAI